MKDKLVVIVALLLCLSAVPVAQGVQIVNASLTSGDYGGGLMQDTMDPDHGGSPHVLGITDGPSGVTFTPTETAGRSNAVIYWQPPNRSAFRQHGAVSLDVYVDHSVFTAATGQQYLWGENYGWNAFRHGQTTIDSPISHRENDPASDVDDELGIFFHVWHNSVWYWSPMAFIPYNEWHTLGYAWGGAHDYEISVDGCLRVAYDLPSGVSLPWGLYSSGTNWGLGDLHERGYTPYASASGVTYANLQIWDNYLQLGVPCQDAVVPEPTTIGLLGTALLGAVVARKRRI